MQVDIDDKKESSTAIQIFTLIAVVLIVGLPIYAYFKLKPNTIFNTPTITETDEDEEFQNESLDPVESNLITDKTQPIISSEYIEELVEIEGQWAYIIVPAYIDIENLPTLIIYNHGSTTFIEETLNPDFKSDLLKYGKSLIPYNYIIATSNAHGANMGNLDSINDNYNLYQYIKNKYGIQDSIYEIGFSMGGLPAINFATRYPELVSKIALLAPVTPDDNWGLDELNKVKNIDIKIWHGDKDQNIEIKYS